MPFTLPKHAVIAIAGGVSAVIIGACVVLLPKVGGNDPADILPAAQTTALIRHATPDTISRMAPYVAGLDRIPLPTDHAVDVALLTLADGTPAWVLFDTSTAPAGMRFSITASDTVVQPLIGKGESRLSQTDAYRELRGFASKDTASAFIQPNVRLTSEGTALLALPDPVIALFEQDRTRIALGDAPGFPSWTSARSGTMHDATLMIQLDDAAGLSELASFLSPQVRSLLESRMRTAVAGLFGNGISPLFDLLPLVRGSFSLQAKKTPKGWTAVLSGQTDDAVKARKEIDALHTAFAASQPGIEVLTRAFDKQFSYIGIRKTGDTAKRDTEQYQGYDVVKSVAAGSGTLITGIAGSSVVIGNDEAAFKEVLGSPDVMAADGVHLDATTLPTLLPSIPWNTGLAATVSRANGRLIIDIPR